MFDENAKPELIMKLHNLAVHPNTPPAEARAAAAKRDKMLLSAQITLVQLLTPTRSFHFLVFPNEYISLVVNLLIEITGRMPGDWQTKQAFKNKSKSGEVFVSWQLLISAEELCDFTAAFHHYRVLGAKAEEATKEAIRDLQDQIAAQKRMLRVIPRSIVQKFRIGFDIIDSLEQGKKLGKKQKAKPKTPLSKTDFAMLDGMGNLSGERWQKGQGLSSNQPFQLEA